MGKIRAAINAIYKDKKELGGITQESIAKRLDCSQSGVSQYLSGERTMSEDIIESFCDALGVKLSDLEQWNPELAKIRMEPPPTKETLGICGKHLSLLQRLDETLDKPGNEKWIPVVESFLKAEGGNSPNSAGDRQSEIQNDPPTILLESGRRLRQNRGRR